MTTQTKTFAPDAAPIAGPTPATVPAVDAPAAGSVPATATPAAGPATTTAAPAGASGSQASNPAVAPASGPGPAARPVVPGPERCAFLRALGAIRDGAVSFVATTALVLGAAWLLRRA